VGECGVSVGEWASGRVGEWASGRVGEWASGRVGEWASGRVGEWASGTRPPYCTPMDVGTLDLGPPEFSGIRIQNSELRIQPAGTRRGGERGSSPKPIGAPPRGRVENPVSSGFLEGSGARCAARARRGLTSLDFFQPLQPFPELGRDLSGGPGRLKKNVRRFPNRTASGDYNPRPVIVPPGTAAHLEGESTPRTESTSLHIAAAHTAHESDAHTLLTFHAFLSSQSTRSPPSVFVFLRFVGSSVPPLLLLYYYFTTLLYYFTTTT